MPDQQPNPSDPSETASPAAVTSPAAVSGSGLNACVEVVPGGPVDGSIRPPGSKSLTNRALLCASMAAGRSVLKGALRSEDTEVMIEALRRVGVDIDVADGGRTLTVTGISSPSQVPSTEHASATEPLALFIANSGTTIRFLAAALSAFGGDYRLHGVPRMHERPIGDLVDAIAPLIDGTIAAESAGGCPPVRIKSGGWRDGQLRVGGGVSSQYLSGLMMAAPIARCQRDIAVIGELVSKPYVEMTAAVMRSFGAEVVTGLTAADADCGEAFRIGQASYQAADYAIEPDASAASYFWATAAITGGTITVEGLTRGAMQGDVGFCDVLQQMGCSVSYNEDSVTVTGGHLQGVDVDMNAISDTVQTLAVVALFADGPTRVRGVAHNRFKETDRIGDLACELRKLGAEVIEHEDGMTIVPPDGDGLHGGTLETYHDHRMAMSLSLAGLRIAGVRILNPSCTVKTYPEYFADLESLTGRPHLWSSGSVPS